MPEHNIITVLSDYFARLGLLSLRYRWWVLIICLLILAASLYFARTVRIDNGFENFFDAEDRSYAAYQQYRVDFGSDEVAYLMYEVPGAKYGVFDYAAMQSVQQLSRALEQDLPFVKQVRSLTNAEVMLGREDEIEFVKLEDDFPASQEGLLEFRQLILGKPIHVGGLVSADGQYGAISVEMTRSSIDPIDMIRLDPEGGDGLDNLYPQVVDSRIRAILQRPEYQHLKFWVSGDVPLNAVYNTIIEKDMAVSTGLGFVVVALILAAFFRTTVLGVVGPLVVVFLAISMTVGFLGLMGWDIDMLFGMLPTFLTAVGVAQAVHIISEFRVLLQQYGDRRKALQETLYLVATPCLLTSLTTAAGFLAMSVSPIKSLFHLSIYTAVGVLVAFFLSLTMLTFFLSFGKDAKVQVQQDKRFLTMDAVLEGIASFVIRFKHLILLFTVLLVLMVAIGISKIRIDSNYLLDFNPSEPIRADTEFIDDKMGGMNSVVYLFDTGEVDGLKNPQALRELERVQNFANQQTDIVKKSYSIVDLIKDINQSFHAGDPAYYKIPESQQLVAQYLLLYEMSGGEEIENFVTSDFSRASLELRTRLTDTSLTAHLTDSIAAYQHQHPPSVNTVDSTGIGVLWIGLLDYITTSQIRGVTLALIVISAMMCFIFRSIKVGLVSMLPNIAPILLTLGMMGWMGITLDYLKCMIASVAIGIAVDDTIHLLTRYQHEFRRCGNYELALRRSMRSVGRALLITSTVLVAAFLVYTGTEMDNMHWFGLLLASTVITALFADFLVMPALILYLKPFGAENSAGESRLASASA